jgi:hypothetical protein
MADKTFMEKLQGWMRMNLSERDMRDLASADWTVAIVLSKYAEDHGPGAIYPNAAQLLQAAAHMRQ